MVKHFTVILSYIVTWQKKLLDLFVALSRCRVSIFIIKKANNVHFEERR